MQVKWKKKKVRVRVRCFLLQKLYFYKFEEAGLLHVAQKKKKKKGKPTIPSKLNRVLNKQKKKISIFFKFFFFSKFLFF